LVRSVSIPTICVHTHAYTRTAGVKMSAQSGERGGVRELLMGRPLSQRDGDDEVARTAAELDEWMHAIHAFLPQILGRNEAAKQALMEFERFAKLPATRDGVVCKRAALLFTLAREPEIAHALLHQCDASAADVRMTIDLERRVLPFVCPLFLKNSCQSPDAFCAFSVVLSEMWAGEKLGNFPLPDRAAATVATDDDA